LYLSTSPYLLLTTTTIHEWAPQLLLLSGTPGIPRPSLGPLAEQDGLADTPEVAPDHL
jgi:hypothetical protein